MSKTTNMVTVKVQWPSLVGGRTVGIELTSQVNHVEADLKAIKAAIEAAFNPTKTPE